MFLNLFRREENPVPSLRIKAIYVVFVVTVLLFYSMTMVMNERKPEKIAKLIKKARIIAGTIVSSQK